MSVGSFDLKPVNVKNWGIEVRYFVLFAVLLVAGCDTVATAIDDTIAENTPQSGPETEVAESDVEHCELVNGTEGCADTATVPEPTQAPAPTQAEIDRTYAQTGAYLACTAGSTPDTIVSLALHCGPLLRGEPISQPTAASSPVPASTPAPVSTPTGGFRGCVWQGQAFQPGNRIGVDQGQGLLQSRDLTINGTTFDVVSGSSGPWQLCECQMSRAEWGCV